MTDLYLSMPSSRTELRLGRALKVLRNLILEIEDVMSHLTTELKSDKMTATTGKELGRNRAGALDCASTLVDPFSNNLELDYD
jgi:hypothetical protein